jgi:hypothetical protein
MLYQDIVNIFRTSDSTVSGANRFYHGTRKEMALMFDKPMPQTHMLPVSSRWDTNNDVMIHDVIVACWQQDDLANSMTQSEAIVQASQVRLMALINHVKDNNPLISISEVTMTPEKKTLMSTVSGYSARLNIISKVPC